jgi:hypothetical protein
MDLGRVALRNLATRRNLAEEAQGVCLVATLLVLMGERPRALGEGLRLLQAAGQQMRLSQGETTAHLKDYHFHCSGLFDRLREQHHRVGDASGQSVGRTQGRSYLVEINREVCVLTEAHSAFESGEPPMEVALADGQ